MTTTARMPSTFIKTATAEGSYWHSSLSSRQLLQQMRGKTAAIGGDQEQGFEQAFSSLAYSYLKDKAPRLLDYIVGFQLVDRDEDNTKAVGVFGFKVGKQWLYAPVFFLNGDFKGHELLYIKNQDCFVPMKENWVNYVLAKKPHILGEGSQKDVYQLGGLSPNIERLSWPPSRGGKYGSDQHGLQHGAEELMSKLALVAAGTGAIPAPGTPAVQIAPVVPPQAAAAGGMPAAGAMTGTAGINKIAAMFDSWVRPVVPTMLAAKLASVTLLIPDDTSGRKLDMKKVAADPFKAALAGSSIDLRDVLASDLQMAGMASAASNKYPLLKLAFDRFYGRNFFPEIAARLKSASDSILKPLPPRTQKQARARRDSIMPAVKIAAGPPPAVKIMTDSDVATTKNIDIEDKKKVLNHGYLVKDMRRGEEVSVAYNTQVRQELTNPSETGIYEVLERPVSFDRMLVISNPYSNRGGNNCCTVVRLGDGQKSWINAHRSAVFAKKVELDEDFRKWFDGLGDKEKLEKGATYIAVSAGGEGTVPFVVVDSYPDSEYELYKVDFKTSVSEYRPQYMPTVENRSDPYDGYISTYDAKLIINTRDGSKLRAVGGELHVPEKTFKFVKLKDAKKPKRDDDNLMKSEDSNGSGSDPKPIVCGDIKDVQLLLTEKTAGLKLHVDHHEITMTSKLGTETMLHRPALFSLIRDHGLREADAEVLLKTAEQKGHVQVRIAYGPQYPLQKSAYPYPEPGAGPTGPAIPAPLYGSEPVGYNNVNAIYPQEETLPVPGLSSSMTDPRVYDPFLMPDQNATQTAQMAGQQGQKEVFDTAMLAGMLKSVRHESLVDKYLPSLMKSLDALGRIAFGFYWHQDDFADRYGRETLPEMEDGIRNSFEGLGDLILVLREKTIEPGLDEDTDPSIEEVADN